MNKHFCLRASIFVAATLVLPLAQAMTMSKDDYKAGKTRIGAEYKVNREACNSLAANAKDICVAEAKGKEKVALAEFEHTYTALPKDQTKAFVARADAVYAVDKERCDDMKGNEKDVCVKKAKSVHVAALADAKLGKTIVDAKKDNVQDKRDAEYKVAAERCDSLAGDAKSNCITAAKTKFGKN